MSEFIKTCQECGNIHTCHTFRHDSGKFTKQCPECDAKQSYGSMIALNFAINRNSKCRPCGQSKRNADHRFKKQAKQCSD